MNDGLVFSTPGGVSQERSGRGSGSDLFNPRILFLALSGLVNITRLEATFPQLNRYVLVITFKLESMDSYDQHQEAKRSPTEGHRYCQMVKISRPTLSVQILPVLGHMVLPLFEAYSPFLPTSSAQSADRVTGKREMAPSDIYWYVAHNTEEAWNLGVSNPAECPVEQCPASTILWE